MSETDWMNEAACNGADPELFFELYEKDRFVAEAVDEVCMNCPVRKLCLADAKANGEAHGVWGGVFFEYGKISVGKNGHKTPAVWNVINAD